MIIPIKYFVPSGMDPELRKKLIVPVVVFLGILAINTNSIISAASTHNTTRIVIASVSSLIVLVVLIIVIRRIAKGNNKTP